MSPRDNDALLGTVSSQNGPVGPPVVLVSGFEPFGGDAFNPSAAIAERLAGEWIRGPNDSVEAVIRSVVLPCVFDVAMDRLQAAMRRLQPSVVIALGLAASRRDISVERVAINLDDARIADNAGRQPQDRPIRPRGPVGYWSTLPVKAIVSAIQAAGLPASLSHSAGTFVCNHVFYGLSHRIATMRTARPRGGFIHVPMPVTDGSGPTLDELVDGIWIAATVSALHRGADAALIGGAID